MHLSSAFLFSTMVNTIERQANAELCAAFAQVQARLVKLKYDQHAAWAELERNTRARFQHAREYAHLITTDRHRAAARRLLGGCVVNKPTLRTYSHPYVARLGQHYIAITSPLLAGPHSALAYLKGRRIYTRDACFDRETGQLIYGVLRVPTVLAAETVLKPGDVRELALWGASGWELLQADECHSFAPSQSVRWPAPAYLPTLDR